MKYRVVCFVLLAAWVFEVSSWPSRRNPSLQDEKEEHTPEQGGRGEEGHVKSGTPREDHQLIHVPGERQIYRQEITIRFTDLNNSQAIQVPFKVIRTNGLVVSARPKDSGKNNGFTIVQVPRWSSTSFRTTTTTEAPKIEEVKKEDKDDTKTFFFGDAQDFQATSSVKPLSNQDIQNITGLLNNKAIFSAPSRCENGKLAHDGSCRKEFF